jgi:uncharacterized protein YkwD
MPGMPGTPPLGPAAQARVRVRAGTPRAARRAAALAVAALLAAVLAGAPARAAGPPAGCPAATAPLGAAADAAVEAAVGCLVGAERAARGLPSVRPDAALALAAQRHAGDMVARAYFAHVSPTGGTVDRRARRAGYLDAPCWALGEDLGWAPPALATAEAVVAAWMASPSHRSVILDPDFRDIGVAVAGRAPVGDGAGATFVLELGATTRCGRPPGGAAPRARVRAG